jgi:anaerobic selenocysteine-containing dehydrogenase
MPIRGHSGVHGGAETGAYGTALPGGLAVTPENAARFAELWGSEVPSAPGRTVADRLGLADGDLVTLKGAAGSMARRVVRATVAPGNLQVHWPEGEVPLARGRRSPVAGIPDHNAVVTLA